MTSALVACTPFPTAEPPRAKPLSHWFSPPEAMPVELLLGRVVEVFGVAAEAIYARDRHKSPAAARHVFAWLLRQRGMSYPEIGRELGNRDHTTIMSACRKVEQEIMRDTPLGAAAAGIELERQAWSPREPKSDPCAALRAVREGR